MGLEVCKLHFPGSFGRGLPVRFCLTGRAIKMRKERKSLCFPFPFSISLRVSLSSSSPSALSHFSFSPSFLWECLFHYFSFWGCGPLSMILGSGSLISDLPSALLFHPLTFYNLCNICPVLNSLFWNIWVYFPDQTLIDTIKTEFFRRNCSPGFPHLWSPES